VTATGRSTGTNSDAGWLGCCWLLPAWWLQHTLGKWQHCMYGALLAAPSLRWFNLIQHVPSLGSTEPAQPRGPLYSLLMTARCMAAGTQILSVPLDLAGTAATQ
jgi:hypothetical protein